MTVTGKRWILAAVAGTAGVAFLGCAGMVLFSAASYRMRDGAMGVGMLNGLCLLLVFAALSAIDRRGFGWACVTGIALSAIGGVFGSLILLANALGDYPAFTREYALNEWSMTSVIVAAFACIGCWICGPRVTGLHRLLQIAGVLGWAGYCGLFLLEIWSHLSSQYLEPLMTVFALLAGAAVVNLFALHQRSGLRQTNQVSAIDQAVFVRCPRCLREQELPVGESRCGGCALRFTIEVEEPACPGCGYNLRGLARPQCPECGKMIVGGAVGVGEVSAAPL